jgi:hypothetical protein
LDVAPTNNGNIFVNTGWYGDTKNGNDGSSCDVAPTNNGNIFVNTGWYGDTKNGNDGSSCDHTILCALLHVVGI